MQYPTIIDQQTFRTSETATGSEGQDPGALIRTREALGAWLPTQIPRTSTRLAMSTLVCLAGDRLRKSECLLINDRISLWMG